MHNIFRFDISIPGFFSLFLVWIHFIGNCAVSLLFDYITIEVILHIFLRYESVREFIYFMEIEHFILSTTKKTDKFINQTQGWIFVAFNYRTAHTTTI